MSWGAAVVLLLASADVVSGLAALPPSVLWTRQYHGSGECMIAAACRAHDGNTALLGTTSTAFVREQREVWLFVLDSGGAVVWSRTYRKAGWESACALTATRDGGYAFAALMEERPQNLWVAKVDSVGNITWEDTSAQSNSLRISGILEAEKGDLSVVLGELPEGDADWNLRMLRFSGQGRVLRDTTYGRSPPLPRTEAYGMAATDDGGCLVAGFSFDGPIGQPLARVWRIRADGAITWSRVFADARRSEALCAAAVADGGFGVGGGGTFPHEDNSDILVLRLDSTGRTQWVQRLGGPANDIAYDIRSTSDGGFIVSGVLNEAGDPRPFLARLDPHGGIMWTKEINEWSGRVFRTTDVVELADGGYLVVGTRYEDYTGFVSRLGPDQVLLSRKGRIRVTLIQASASLVSDVYMRSPDSILLIRNNLTNVGTVVDTVYEPGTALVFSILVHGADSSYHHLSNSLFAHVTKPGDSTWIIGFEDLPAATADWDFNDVVVRVELLPPYASTHISGTVGLSEPYAHAVTQRPTSWYDLRGRVIGRGRAVTKSEGSIYVLRVGAAAPRLSLPTKRAGTAPSPHSLADPGH